MAWRSTSSPAAAASLARTTPTRSSSRQDAPHHATKRTSRCQTAELGKVDVGGGGTIAYICAKYGMNVIDCGIPVLSMHAPWEVISKVDLWEEYKCYCAFLKGAREF